MGKRQQQRTYSENRNLVATAMVFGAMVEVLRYEFQGLDSILFLLFESLTPVDGQVSAHVEFNMRNGVSHLVCTFSAHILGYSVTMISVFDPWNRYLLVMRCRSCSFTKRLFARLFANIACAIAHYQGDPFPPLLPSR